MSVTIVPGQKLTELTAISSIALTDLLYIVKASDSTSYSSTLSVLKESLAGPFASTFLPLSGGTMTGYLTLTGVPLTTNNAATKGYVDTVLSSITAIDFARNYLPLSGGSMTGRVTLTGVPFAVNDAASKGYVDTNFLSLAGGTMAGSLILSGNPTLNYEAATKAYVDSITGTKVTVKTICGNNCGDAITSTGAWRNYIIDNNNVLRCSGLFGTRIDDGKTIVYNGGMGASGVTIDGFRPSGIQFLTTTEYPLSVLGSGYATWVLSNSGTVYSAGKNAYGTLGFGSTQRSMIFKALTSIALTASQLVASSGYYQDDGDYLGSVFVIDKSSNLWAWGSNATGQLGFANTVGKPAAGNDGTWFWAPCAVNVGGVDNKVKSVVSTGYNKNGSTYAILTGGELYATGYNNNGQLGLGDRTNRASFTRVGNVSADAIYTSSRGYATYIIHNGALSAAGDNTSGNLGNGRTGGGTAADNLTFQPVFSADSTGSNIGPLRDVKYVSVNDGYAGAVSVFALTNDNRVFAWGNNGGGQLGFGDKKNRLYATQVATATKVQTFGYGNTNTATALLSDGSIYVAGWVTQGIDGQGDGPDRFQLTFQKVGQPQGVQWVNFQSTAQRTLISRPDIQINAAGVNVLFAIDTFNNLWAWGSNVYNESGMPTDVSLRGGVGGYRIDLPRKVAIID
jgi:alpha-tubulin suppressor-like RCC1 family protein